MIVRRMGGGAACMEGGELLLARFSDFHRRESTTIVHAVVAPQIDAACRNSSAVGGSSGWNVVDHGLRHYVLPGKRDDVGCPNGTQPSDTQYAAGKTEHAPIGAA